MVFEIADEENFTKNLGQFLSILRNNALEVLSMEDRSLEAHEALYLRFRQLKMREKDLYP